jgi:hypothetical protein
MRTVDDLRTALDYHAAPVTPDPGAIIARARRRRATRRTLLAAGLAAVVSGTVALGVLPEGGGGAQPAAAAVLNRAAGAAAAAPAPATADGTVWFTETRHEALHLDVAVKRHPAGGPDEAVGTFLVQRRLTTRVWLALPDRQRADQSVEKYGVAPPSEAAWIAAGRPDFIPPAGFTDDPGTKDAWQLLLDEHIEPKERSLKRELELLRALPTDQGRLEGWLREQVRASRQAEALAHWCPADAGTCTEDAEVFQAATALLASPVASPPLRSALFRVLAGLRDVRLDGTVTDGAGRTATKVSTMTGHLRYEVLFDARSATLLATQEVLATAEDPDTADPSWRGAAVGSVVRSQLFLRRQVVAVVGSTA